MYLRQLHVQNVKLLRDTKVSFTAASGDARMWTVFVGENRLCKTTLLQTIAAAAVGRDFGTQLVTDVVASWPDLRRAEPVEATIEARFGFSAERHVRRTYPGFEISRDEPSREGAVSPAPGIELFSSLNLQPRGRVLDGDSRFTHWPPWFKDVGVARAQDILTIARARELRDWFVAGYGPTRLLPSPGKASRTFDPMLDRLRPLFGESLIGIGFVDLLSPELGRAFAKLLDKVFVGGGILPHVNKIELRGRGGINTAKDLAEAHLFEVATGSKGGSIRVPAGWLSQGYQSLLAWVADFVGHILLESGAHVESEEMEGLVLIDEIDLHLHPTWQVKLIPALKKAFPRLQFIATTHSPMVLPGLEAEEVWLLEQDEDGSVTARPSPRAPALLTGSELYGSFFDMNELYPNDLGERARRYGALATDPTRTEAEDTELRILREILEKAGVTYDWEPVEREAAE
jgi:AAA domain, putative AbiEii toxin, Type IV TA system